MFRLIGRRDALYSFVRLHRFVVENLSYNTHAGTILQQNSAFVRSDGATANQQTELSFNFQANRQKH